MPGDVTLQRALLSAALCVALVGYRGTDRARFACALLLGAGLAHFGWVALYADRLLAHGFSWIDPMRGFSVLFMPLGPCLVALARPGPKDRRRFIAAALRALPLALACARLGCVLAGCCGGAPSDASARDVGTHRAGDWLEQLIDLRHPTALYDLLGLVVLHFAVARSQSEQVFGRFALGFGIIRLAVEPLRVAAPLGPPLVPVAWIAAAWSIAGFVSLGRRTAIVSLTRSRIHRSRGAVRRLWFRRPFRCSRP